MRGYSLMPRETAAAPLRAMCPAVTIGTSITACVRSQLCKSSCAVVRMPASVNTLARLASVTLVTIGCREILDDSFPSSM